MGLQCGGVEGGWMQVVDVNMTQDDSCPGTWWMITSPIKLCVGGVNAGCDSAHFNTKGVKFQHICGQTKSYQKGFPDAFQQTTGKGIDEIFMLMEYLSPWDHHDNMYGLMLLVQMIFKVSLCFITWC